MKIGKQAKRFGGPSPQFMARKAAETDRSDQKVPKAGLVPVYLDDERKCPPGWTLVRSPKALFELLEGDKAIADRITHLSLDWYLGVGIMDGVAVAEWIAERFRADPGFLPKLDAIGLHSSDRDKAVAMFRILQDAIPEERWYDMRVDTGTPRL